MGLHFQETMSGTIQTAEGPRAFSFSASADSSSAIAFGGVEPLLLTGTADLEGVVKGARLLPGSSLQIGLPVYRYLRYQVSFEDDQGHLYRYFGQKWVRLSSLVSTMMTLKGRLFCDGEEVGPGTLRFAPSDFLPFLASWRPWAVAAR